jgi:hypothetical protein
MILSAIVACVAAENPKIEGYLKDRKTGAPYPGVRIDVYPSDDHSNLVAYTQTDNKGYYSLTVPAGKYYDVYVRMGEANPTQRTNTPTVDGGVYTLNFDLESESSYSNVIVEKYGIWIVVLVSLVVLGIIFFDVVFRLIFGRRKERIIVETKTTPQAQTEPSKVDLNDLVKEKAEIESEIELTKTKYHKRLIDEESFREIVRDQQKKLIEIETRIKSIKGET